MTPLACKVDSKGRVNLGKAFANRLVLVRELGDGVVEIVRAEAVPAPELWLHRNPRAIRAVMEGLAQAKEGELVEGPSLDELDDQSGKSGV